MKKPLTITILIIFLTILLVCSIMFILIILELQNTGEYLKENLSSDFRLSLLIVFPQVITISGIFYYLSKKNKLMKAPNTNS